MEPVVVNVTAPRNGVASIIVANATNRCISRTEVFIKGTALSPVEGDSSIPVGGRSVWEYPIELLEGHPRPQVFVDGAAINCGALTL